MDPADDPRLDSEETPPETPEAELVERATTGDREAVEQLLARHLPRLERYVRLRAGALLRSEGVSDLVQSTCRELLEKADRFRFGGEDAACGVAPAAKLRAGAFGLVRPAAPARPTEMAPRPALPPAAPRPPRPPTRRR